MSEEFFQVDGSGVDELDRVGSIQSRIQLLVDKAGNPNAFSAKTGLSVSGVKRYLAGGEPTASKILQMCEPFGVSPGWLLTGEGAMSVGEADVKRDGLDDEFAFIPGYRVQVSAGHGSTSDAPSNPYRRLAFRRRWLQYRGFNESDLTVVWASGDSMEPTIGNNDTLVVHTGRTKPVDGNIYVFRNGDDLFVKRYQDSLGNWLLISDNPIYEKISVAKQEQHQFQVIGQVVHIAKDVGE